MLPLLIVDPRFYWAGLGQREGREVSLLFSFSFVNSFENQNQLLFEGNKILKFCLKYL